MKNRRLFSDSATAPAAAVMRTNAMRQEAGPHRRVVVVLRLRECRVHVRDVRLQRGVDTHVAVSELFAERLPVLLRGAPRLVRVLEHHEGLRTEGKHSCNANPLSQGYSSACGLGVSLPKIARGTLGLRQSHKSCRSSPTNRPAGVRLRRLWWRMVATWVRWTGPRSAKPTLRVGAAELPSARAHLAVWAPIGVLADVDVVAAQREASEELDDVLLAALEGQPLHFHHRAILGKRLRAPHIPGLGLRRQRGCCARVAHSFWRPATLSREAARGGWLAEALMPHMRGWGSAVSASQKGKIVAQRCWPSSSTRGNRCGNGWANLALVGRARQAPAGRTAAARLFSLRLRKPPSGFRQLQTMGTVAMDPDSGRARDGTEWQALELGLGLARAPIGH